MKKCLHNYESTFPPCISLRVEKNTNLSDFIKGGQLSGTKHHIEIASKIKCILFIKEEHGHHIDIKNDYCINCMFCVFGCPGSQIEIRNDFLLKAMCSNFSANYKDKLAHSTLDQLFSGEFINLPCVQFGVPAVNYKSFEDFTSKDEVNNISVWAANALKYLSTSNTPRIGLEVGINISTRDRQGRLDICLLSNKILFVAEAKVNFNEIMKNKADVEAQLIRYKNELASKTSEVSISFFKFLLIGGEESDLLPSNHKGCTSTVGKRSQEFYESVVKNQFFFISSNALLSLSLLKLFCGEKFSLENVYHKIFKERLKDGFIGLLSCGLVCHKDGCFEIIPLKDKLGIDEN